MLTHISPHIGYVYSPRMGSLWWQCCPQGPSGWRTATSPGHEAAQTCSEPPAASQCLRAEWCYGRSLWSGISTEARTLAASPCQYMPSTQTGLHTMIFMSLYLCVCYFSVFRHSPFLCSHHLCPPLLTEVVQSLLVFVGPHLGPSLPLVPRTPGAGLEVAGVNIHFWWRSSSPRYLYSIFVCWVKLKLKLEVFFQ